MSDTTELREAIKEFLVESHENLDQLDNDLVGLEKAAAPGEALGRIFRTLHTIKGSCSFLGFPRLEAVAHAGEGLLGKLRDGTVAVGPGVTDVLLRVVDAIRSMLRTIEEEGHDGTATHEKLIQLLQQAAAGQLPTGGTLLEWLDEISRMETGPDEPAVGGTIMAPTGSSGLLPGQGPESFTVSDGAAVVTAAEPAVREDPSSVYDASVRIHVDLLDKLMAVAGEIVLARNQILQFSQKYGDPAFQNTCRQLNLITTELQEHVMKTRLQPLGNVWSRFPRLVRDAAHACGKKVRLETEGSETELDKTLLEAIRDPLTHLLRNAVDHGIERPEHRVTAGKPEEGCVRLQAYHEGGQVNIEVSDDGGGIDPERIKHKAVAQHLVTTEEAEKMSDQSLLGLIFLPGFSTAAAVTTVSGRGVGMDVVKTNVEKIGGSVDVHSAVGQGTTVRVRIPLTLAIIKVLVVTSAGDRYAIPQVSILELVRVEGEKLRKGIHRVHGALVYRYRDRLLPLVNLNQALKVEARSAADDAVNIVVLQAADRQFGLVVDGINDTQEIVVKPLWKHLKSLACFAGATVMGDGKVALILDVFGLAQRAGAITDLQALPVTEAQPAMAHRCERPSVLLVEGRDRSRMAIPLSKVSRLEEFRCDCIERVADRYVMQYCGQILPLLDVDVLLGSATAERNGHRDVREGKESLQVVVYSGEPRQVGLIVERILDIVEHDTDVQGRATRHGVDRLAVVQGHVTEMLHVETLIQGAEV
jgi:two-component system chemotaxis sensor kinase CheA